MRKVWILLFVALMLPFYGGIAEAAFDNSHHDLRSYNAQTEGCFHCHGRTDTSTVGAAVANMGNVGGLCLGRCHAGTGILTSNNQLVPATAPSVNPVDYTTSAANNYSAVQFNRSHGRTPGNLMNVAFNAAPAAATWPPTGGAGTWPYMAAGTSIECTSCHAVHDNAKAPFIWAPLGPSAAGAFDGFCDRCHNESGRSANALAAAPNGNHPINFVVDNVAAAGRTGNTRHGRRIVIQQYGAGANVPVFDVASPAGNTLVNATNPSTAWNMGGHLVTPGTEANQFAAAMATWTPTGGTAVMGCFTCHAAHRTNVNGENNLVVVRTDDAGATTPAYFNTLCVGCHGNATTRAGDINEEGVGTTAWNHPVGADTAYTTSPNIYTTSVGGFQFAVTTTLSTPALTYTYGQNVTHFGTSGQVLCNSCHKVHGGNRMSITNLGQTGAICKQCHSGVGIPNLDDFSKGGSTGTGHNQANVHHVTRATAMTLPGAITAAGETVNPLLQMRNPSWYTAAGDLGDISGSMDCADCHVFNKTAHNW